MSLKNQEKIRGFSVATQVGVGGLLSRLLCALVTLPPQSRLGAQEAVDCRDLKLGKGLSISHWRAKPGISDFA